MSRIRASRQVGRRPQRAAAVAMDACILIPCSRNLTPPGGRFGQTVERTRRIANGIDGRRYENRRRAGTQAPAGLLSPPDGLGRDRIKATCPTSRDSVVKCPVERHISYGTFLKAEPMAAFRRPQRAHDLEEGVSLHTRRLAERRLTTVEARGLDGPRLGAE